MPTTKKLTQQIAQNLLSNDVYGGGNPIDYLSHLNTAGLHSKGLLSSCHAMNGVSLKGKVKTDFLAAIVPFVHAQVGVSLEGEAAANGMLVVQRGASKLWNVEFSNVPAAVPEGEDQLPIVPPVWYSLHPQSLTYLRGKSGRYNGGVSADVWAGVGNPRDIDETGISVGAFAEGSAEGTLTSLQCNEPQYFAGYANNKTISHAVELVLIDNLKNKAALWLLANGNGIKEAAEFGAVVQLPTLKKEMLTYLGKTSAGAVPDWTDAALKAFVYTDTTTQTTTVGVSNALGNVGTAWKAMRKIASKCITLIKGGTPKTSELIELLVEAEKALESTKTFFDISPDVLNRTSARKRKNRPEYNKVTDELLEEFKTITDMRIQEAKDLIVRLRARKDDDDRQQQEWPYADKKDGVPVSRLRIGTFTKQAEAGAVAKATLNAPHKTVDDDVPMLQLAAAGNVEGYSKKITIEFQYPTRGEYIGGRLSLMTTQHSIVRHTVYAASAQAKAGAGSKRKEASGNATGWVTMTYESVIVDWFDELGAITGNDGHQTQHNSSGAAFGMSVLRDRLAKYRKALEVSAHLGTGLSKVELTMMKQLRVTKDELQRFILDIPEEHLYSQESDVEDDEGYALLVESAFVFTKQHKLNVINEMPDNLFDLPPVTHLRDNDAPDSGSRLQSIRLRYRVQSQDETKTTIFSLGYSNKPFEKKDGASNPVSQLDAKAEQFGRRIAGMPLKAPDAADLALQTLPVSFGVGAEWVTRTSAEGIVDLHTCLYPPLPEKPGSQQFQTIWAEEVIMPSVVLFHQ